MWGCSEISSMSSFRKAMCSKNPFQRADPNVAKLWNTITPKLKVSDLTMSIDCLRRKLKESLLVIQHKNSGLDWTSEDFNSTNLTFEKLK